MNRKVLTLLSFAVVVLAAGIIGVASVMQQNTGNKICTGVGAGAHFQIVIRDGTVRPNQISGQLCDRITFTNKDSETRELAFGPHENHVAYDGVREQTLHQNQSLTITLDQAGTFYFHDHDHDEVSGQFVVTQ